MNFKHVLPMKKFKFLIKSLLILFAGFFILCCQKDNPALDEHMIEFELNLLQEESGSLLKSSEIYDLEKAAKIIITITTTSGWYIGITSAEFDIQKLGDTYLSDKIMLKKGCYKLTEFMLADSSGNIIYAAPTEGTILGEIVNNPLPMAFCVDANESNKILVEVINTNNKTPEEFGIASFYMINPPVFKFPVAVVDWETGEFLAATLEITNTDWDANVSSYQKPIDKGTDVYRRIIQTQAIANNLVVLDDTYPTYTIKVTKDGYIGYSDTFTKDSLDQYAIPDKKKVLKFEISPTFIDSIYDIDGNSYKIVKIGTQVWMQDNLYTTRYNEGTPLKSYECEWVYTDGYHPEPYRGVEVFYYSRVMLRSRNICPEGWHIPTLDEWNILINFLGGPNVAGGKLKGGDEWDCDQDVLFFSNYSSRLYKMNNLSNFTARPYTPKYFNGTLGLLFGGLSTSFWALSADGTTTYSISMSSDSYGISYGTIKPNCLRCIKD